mgnify:CR=1 FL=1
MKNKYQRLNKEEKKIVSKEYFNTKLGKYVKRKLTSAFICGILCIIISIFLFVYGYKDGLTFIDYFYNISTFVFRIIFIIAPFIIRNKKLNEYVIKHKK